jgi:CBS domain-containing protein
MEVDMKPISEIVSNRPLFSVGKDQTVAEVARFMAEKNVGAIPVMEKDRLVGVFSERDVITRVVAKGLNPAEVKVGDVMTTRIVVANADESYESCLKKMQQAHCRHLPVVSGDQLIGFVSLRDLLMMDLDEKERNLEYLQSYIYTVPPGAAKRYESQT